jgi:hypothetical protein
MNIDDSLLVKRNLPSNISQNDLWLFRKALERKICKPQIEILNNARITGKSIVYKGYKIFPESFVAPSRAEPYRNFFSLTGFLLKHTFFRKRIKTAKPCIWFTDEWSGEYFHWLTDALPRLFIVKDLIPDSVIVLPEKFEKIDFVQNTLKVFSTKEILYLPQRSVLCAQKLYFPFHTAPTGNYNEDIIRSMNRFFIDHSKSIYDVDFGERIYISRQKALRRKIVNEKVIIPILKKYGFSILCFEDYDFDQQLSIISKAKYLVSNHGAGLSNMLFMNPGSKIFELRREKDDHNNCYFSLSSALGHTYFYQVCKSKNNVSDTFIADLEVDPESFEENLRLLLKF